MLSDPVKRRDYNYELFEKKEAERTQSSQRRASEAKQTASSSGSDGGAAGGSAGETGSRGAEEEGEEEEPAGRFFVGSVCRSRYKGGIIALMYLQFFVSSIIAISLLLI